VDEEDTALRRHSPLGSVNENDDPSPPQYLPDVVIDEEDSTLYRQYPLSPVDEKGSTSPQHIPVGSLHTGEDSLSPGNSALDSAEKDNQLRQPSPPSSTNEKQMDDDGAWNWIISWSFSG
jgi:hypothetical protein